MPTRKTIERIWLGDLELYKGWPIGGITLIASQDQVLCHQGRRSRGIWWRGWASTVHFPRRCKLGIYATEKIRRGIWPGSFTVLHRKHTTNSLQHTQVHTFSLAFPVTEHNSYPPRMHRIHTSHPLCLLVYQLIYQLMKHSGSLFPQKIMSIIFMSPWDFFLPYVH